MKDLVKELAENIRESIKSEPPKIVEIQSQCILFDIARTLKKHEAIDAYQFIEMSREIENLYSMQQ